MMVLPLISVSFNLLADNLLGRLLSLIPFCSPHFGNVILIQELTCLRVNSPFVKLLFIGFVSIGCFVVLLMHLPSSVFTAILECYIMLLVASTDCLPINRRYVGSLTQYERWDKGLPEHDDGGGIWIRAAVHFCQFGKFFSGDAIIEMGVIKGPAGDVFGLHSSRWEIPLELEFHLELNMVLVLFFMFEVFVLLHFFVDDIVNISIKLALILL